MSKISAYYDNGLKSHKDLTIIGIADKYGAKLIGSGCWLCEPFTRDLEFEVSEESVAAMKVDLQKEGFRT